MPPKQYPSKKKVPKGSHRMKDGSIMKDSAMKKKKAPPMPSTKAKAKPRKQKFDDNSPMTSEASIPKHVYRVSDLKVEESIKKAKEVKESDIFETPQNKSRY